MGLDQMSRDAQQSALLCWGADACPVSRTEGPPLMTIVPEFGRSVSAKICSSSESA